MPSESRRSVFVLGTAQLGLPHYGRTNIAGQPSRAEALDLLRLACDQGVSEFDTARAYGEAENLLGEAMVARVPAARVITKLDPLTSVPIDADAQKVRAAVDASVFRSCRELRTNSLPVLLLHRWAHRHQWQGVAWQRLTELQGEGVLGLLGASVSSPEEARAALEDPGVRHLQIPFNLLDTRWIRAGTASLAEDRPDVILHARSIFLQGLLLNPATFWPTIPGVNAVQIIQRLDAWVIRLGRIDRMDLCLAYGRSQPWIQNLVLGVETPTQLRELITKCGCKPLLPPEAAEVAVDFVDLPDSLTNPTLWPPRI